MSRVSNFQNLENATNLSKSQNKSQNQSRSGSRHRTILDAPPYAQAIADIWQKCRPQSLKQFASIVGENRSSPRGPSTNVTNEISDKIRDLLKSRNISIVRFVANGPNSAVFLARDNDAEKTIGDVKNDRNGGQQQQQQRLYAVKILFKRQLEEGFGAIVLRRNFDYDRMPSTRTIAALYQLRTINAAGDLMIVTEFGSGGTLASLLGAENGEIGGAEGGAKGEVGGGGGGKQISETIAKSIFTDVLQGLRQLHRRKIAHRNLKLENILLIFDDDSSRSSSSSSSNRGNDKTNMAPPRAMITDFAVSIVMKNVSNYERILCTSLPYLAPEVLSDVPYDPMPADMWSYGVCLFAALNDALPYGICGKPTGCYQMKRSVECALSDAVKRCLLDTLQHDVNKRASSYSLLADGAWFQN